MGGCCRGRCDEVFTERVARRDAARFERRGLDGTSRRVVEAVTRRGIRGRTVLEVGGGVGGIPIALLRAGGARATVVELSAAYESEARRLAEGAGLRGRIDRRVGDFAAAGDVPAADVVVLNRVVCCDPDAALLTGAAARHATALLVLTHPRVAWWTRLGVAAVNAVERLRRHAFRVHLHPPAVIVRAAAAEGLEPADHRRGLVWELRSFVRPAAAPGPAPPAPGEPGSSIGDMCSAPHRVDTRGRP